MSTNNFTSGGGGGGSTEEDTTTTEEETTTDDTTTYSSTDGGTSDTITFDSGNLDDGSTSDTGGSGGTSDGTQFTSGTGDATTGDDTTTDITTDDSTSDTGGGGGTSDDTQFTSGTGDAASGTATGISDGRQLVSEDARATREQSGIDSDMRGPTASRRDAPPKRVFYVAQQAGLDVDEIARVKETDEGELIPVLTDEAQEERRIGHIVEETDLERGEIAGIERITGLSQQPSKRDVDRFLQQSAMFAPVLTDEALEERARESFFDAPDYRNDPSEFLPQDAGEQTIEDLQKGALFEQFDQEDFEFTADDGNVQVGLTDDAVAGIDDSPSPEPTRSEPRASLSDRTGDLVGEIQEEGVSSVERGGALSEAARDTTASALGVVFDRPEEVADTFGISEERARARNTNVSGPELAAIDSDSDGYTIFEFSRGDPGEVNTEVVRTLSQGDGPLTDRQRRQLRRAGDRARETFDVSDELGGAVEDVTGSEGAGSVASGVGTLPGELAAAPTGIALAADTAAQVGPNVPGAVEEYGAVEVGATSLETTGRATESVAQGIEENPLEFAGALGGAAVGGAIIGRGLGKGARFARDRKRTAGATTYDIEEGAVVNTETGAFYSPRSSVNDPDARFPGAADRKLYATDPAESVRRQAEDFTPAEVEGTYQAAGVTEGTTLKKGLEVEPESSQAGRRGFDTQEGSYESPGAFAGPELSPNFLGIGSGRSSFSLRPGLPDFGDTATGVFVRTRVKNPRASTLDEFNEELLGRSGETTARTKPAGVGTAAETEAVIPPQARFVDVGSGGTRNVARRLGIGSDFAVRIGGRRIPFTDRKVGGRKIPLRPVADPDLVDDAPRTTTGGFLSDERGQLGAGTGGRPRPRERGTVSELSSPIEPGTDRPVPLAPGLPSPGSTSPDVGTSNSPRPVSGYDSPTFGVGEDTTIPTSPDSESGSSSSPASSSPGLTSMLGDVSGGSSPGASEGTGSIPGLGSGGSGPPSGGSSTGPPGGSSGRPPAPPGLPGSPGSPGTPPDTPSGQPPGLMTSPPSTSKEKEEFGLFGTLQAPEFADFVNPFTGDVEETR